MECKSNSARRLGDPPKKNITNLYWHMPSILGYQRRQIHGQSDKGIYEPMEKKKRVCLNFLCKLLALTKQLLAWHAMVPNKLNSYTYITVFLSRFGTFLRSELKFSKLLVQSSHHCVICAHQKSSFSFLWTSCKCFGTSMQMIMYNSLLFPTLSIAYVMLIKMYYNGSLLNSLTAHNI